MLNGLLESLKEAELRLEQYKESQETGSIYYIPGLKTLSRKVEALKKQIEAYGKGKIIKVMGIHYDTATNLKTISKQPIQIKKQFTFYLVDVKLHEIDSIVRSSIIGLSAYTYEVFDAKKMYHKI